MKGGVNMSIDELTKEYLLRTFNFKDSTPEDFVIQYFETYDKINEKYEQIDNERKKKEYDKFKNLI